MYGNERLAVSNVSQEQNCCKNLLNPTHTSPANILLFILAIEYLDAIWLRRMKRRVLLLLAERTLQVF